MTENEGGMWEPVDIVERALEGEHPSEDEALALADYSDTPALMRAARDLRDRYHGNRVTFSKKVFIPLTQLCRDVCHYCTFAQPIQ